MRLTDLSYEDWLEHAFGREVRIQQGRRCRPAFLEANYLAAKSGARIVSASAAVSGLDWNTRSPMKG